MFRSTVRPWVNGNNSVRFCKVLDLRLPDLGGRGKPWDQQQRRTAAVFKIVKTYTIGRRDEMRVHGTTLLANG
jgi:hypothetical protein